MLGTFVNCLAIIAGTTVGMLFKNGIPERYNQTVMQAIALSVMLIGIKSALGCPDLLIIIISLAAGALIGEFIGIEAYLKKLGDFLERKFSKPSSGTSSLSTAFVTASLLYCVGSMAIVGSLESGLSGTHDTLFAKSFLDGITSIILTASLGFGVGLSALPVLIYQGAITLAAGFMKPFLVPAVVSQMSATGGLLILAIGLNMLREKKIAVGNMLPAIFLPLVYYLVTGLFCLMDISSVLGVLKQEVAGYKVPVVDLIAVQTRSPFKVLVATILSARTKDEVTAKASQRLFDEAPDAPALAGLTEKKIQKLIFPVGFYKSKAGYLSKLPLALDAFGGRVPDQIEDLVTLPGVGRKTANLVRAVAFDKDAICVDTHVHRIMNIWGYVRTKNPLETETALRKKLPRKHWKEVNSILVAFGQGTCRPVGPHCDACVLKELCPKKGVTPRRMPKK